MKLLGEWDSSPRRAPNATVAHNGGEKNQKILKNMVFGSKIRGSENWKKVVH